MKRIIIAMTVLSLCAAVALAQAPQGPPKPGAEQKRMTYFVGNWNSEGTMKESPFGPAGSFSGSERTEWLTGGFFLVSHTTGKGPMGEMKGMAVMGYDREAKGYTYNEFDSMGQAMAAKGSVSGDTWTWTNDGKTPNGKAYKSRFIIKEVSPTSYTMKWEAAVGGGAMQTVMEGKATKAASASKTAAAPKK